MEGEKEKNRAFRGQLENLQNPPRKPTIKFQLKPQNQDEDWQGCLLPTIDVCARLWCAHNHLCDSYVCQMWLKGPSHQTNDAIHRSEGEDTRAAGRKGGKRGIVASGDPALQECADRQIPRSATECCALRRKKKLYRGDTCFRRLQIANRWTAHTF